MDLARAFTTKRRRPDISLPSPSRSHTTKHHGGHGHQTSRGKISGPIELISTTNMLSFNAPDLRSASGSSTSSASSTHSPTDSDVSAHAFFSSHSSTATTPEGSSAGSRSGSPEPTKNHLASYFSGTEHHQASPTTGASAPSVPQRAPSHTKATHKALARKRSQQNLDTPSPPTSIPPVPVMETQAQAHPFGRELEQVDELAEEFGIRDSVVDEEEQYLMRKGLRKFHVNDYRAEIQSLFGGVFEDQLLPMQWI